MSRYIKSFFVAICLLAGTAIIPAKAQEAALSLTDAVKKAMANNHEIRAASSSLSAQKADIGIARSYLLPKLSFEERAARTNNPPTVFMMKLNQERFTSQDFDIDRLNKPEATTDFQTLFSIDQPVFARKAQIGLAMARQEYAAKRNEFQRKREEIAFQVAQAYLQTSTAREYAGVAATALEDAREYERIANVRYKSDLGLYSDALRSKTAVTEAEQKLVKAEKDLTVAKRWLGLLLGTSDTVEVARERPAFRSKNLDYYTKASLSRRDVSALQIRRENAQNSIKVAESLYFPSLGVRGTYQLNDPNRLFGSAGDSWFAMAYLKWDLFDGTNREFERMKARHKAAETEEYLAGLKQFVSFKIHEAYLAVDEARKNMELARSSLETAEEGKRLVKSRYENSLSPIVDLLDTQVMLERARANIVARENEYQRAILNLGYESGTIMEDLNIE